MTAQHLSVDELAEAAEGFAGPRARGPRRVTPRRLPGLPGPVGGSARVTVLLVYTKSAGSTQVTVVTGCRVGTPSAGPSAVLPR